MKKKSVDRRPQEERKNPYKGLHPYEESDKDMFYGRGEEAERLLQLVKYNLLTVVFGKAGIGKTSLLRAGVFPLLRKEGFLPIPLRPNYSNEASPLMQQIHQPIRAELEKHRIEVKAQGKEESAKPLNPGETLWEYFHRVDHFDPSKGERGDMVTPVLVFDQFEEFLTLDKEKIDKDTLVDELYWMIEDQFPTPLKERILKAGTGDKKDREFSFSTITAAVRVIISLKEDYLVHLSGLKSRIASIDRDIFRINPFNVKQAKEIISMPGGFREKKQVENILRLFYQGSATDEEIISDEKIEIEPTFLSLLCHQLFEKKKLKSITKEIQEKILRDFYDSVMTKYPDEVNQFVESRLLTEHGFRTPFYLEPHHPLSESIDKLEERRILRRFYDGKKQYIELSHDMLAPIVKAKRDKRLEDEKKQGFRNQLKRLFYRKTIGVIAGIAIILALSLWYALNQKHKADRQYRLAEVNRLTSDALSEFPKDNTRAIRIAEAAYKLGLPNPPPRTVQALSNIGYSSLEKPFYITTLHHKKAIYTAVFSSDGNRILTASEDGTAKLWNMEGKCLAVLKHEERVNSAVFSPDDRQILTASWDQKARLWDLQGKALVDLTHNGIVSSAVFSPDGRMILTASRDKTAKIWDQEGKLFQEGKPFKVLKHNGLVSSAVFSRNGQRILTVSSDQKARVWDLGGNLLLELTHDRQLSAAAISPDGKRILTASADNTPKVWNLEGILLVELKKHDKPIFYAEFSPDGLQILTASEDGTTKIWKLEENKPIEKNLTHHARVFSAIFSPNGQQVLTSYEDGTAKVWTLEGKLIAELYKHNGRIFSAVFSTDGKRVLTASEDSTAKVWEIKNKLVVDLNEHRGEVKVAAFSPNGKWIVTASRDRTAKVWDLEGNLLDTMDRHIGAVYSAVFSPDSQLILTASEDGTAKLWDREKKSMPSINLKHDKAVFSAVFSPNGQKIVTASMDESAKAWDLQGNLIAYYPHPGGAVSSAVFSPDGLRILTASFDGTARVWDPEGSKPLELKHNDAVSSAVFSPNGQLILTASDDRTAKLWDRQGKLLLNLDKHDGVVFSALFSPNGRRIITTSWSNTARIWDLKGNLLADLDKHRDIVVFAAFSPDGQRVITTSWDKTAILWTSEGVLQAELNKHKGIVSYAAFSPDNRFILTASRDNTAKLWRTPEAIYQWLREAKIPHLTSEE